MSVGCDPQLFQILGEGSQADCHRIATGRAANSFSFRAADLCEGRFHDLGVTAVAPERRSPEYLAKFVVDEIARWEGPIKANGLQVD